MTATPILGQDYYHNLIIVSISYVILEYFIIRKLPKSDRHIDRNVDLDNVTGKSCKLELV